jgi:signal peptidase II
MRYQIALWVTLADQFTKTLAVNRLQDGSFPVIPNALHMTYVQNSGAAFGIFKNSNMMLTILMAVIIAALLAVLAKKPRGGLWSVASGLILGGAAGNFIDRITRGYVVDFIDVRLFHYAVFNVADSCVVAGVVILFICMMFFDKKEEPNDAAA